MEDNLTGIKAVTFDLYQTLIHDYDGKSRDRKILRCSELSRVMREFGYDISEHEFLEALEKMNFWISDIWSEGKEVKVIEQIRFMLDTLSDKGIRLDDGQLELLADAFSSVIFMIPLKIDPDAVKVLERLNLQGIKVGLICNTGYTPGKMLREFLEQNGIREGYFDFMLFSNEIGMRKPRPEVFKLAAEKFGVEPNKILHIGDNMESDVHGSMEAGFKSIYYHINDPRYKIAESDKNSLLYLSRNSTLKNGKEIVPEFTISKLLQVIKVIEYIERGEVDLI